jgi:hypothetical protein
MPPRIVIAGIVAFWLATTGYTFYRDLWPRLFASGPPPVSIELADEARQNVPARWAILRNGERVGKLTTQMKYLDAEDAFVFTYRYTDLVFEQDGFAVIFSEVVSEVYLTRAGDLKEESITANIEVAREGKVPRKPGQEKRPPSELSGTLMVRGVVNNGVMTGRAELTFSVLNLSGDLEPTPVPAGLPLNPLQPVNRLANVRGGLTWVVHESNPLMTAGVGLLRSKLGDFGIRPKEQQPKESLVAQVKSSPQDLLWQNEVVACWVIEYRRTEVVARTWVRVSDGKVLRQEAFEKGETLTFERED